MRMQSVHCPCCHHDSSVKTLHIQPTDGLHIAECAHCGAEFVMAEDELQTVDRAERIPVRSFIECLVSRLRYSQFLSAISLRPAKAEAATLRFPGTPTVRIDGQDIEPSNQVELPCYSLDCRLHWYDGQFWARPPEQILRQALQRYSSASNRKSAPISTSDESIEKDR
jgi:hypothetical protein